MVSAQSAAATIARRFLCRRTRWLCEWLYESSMSPCHQSKVRGWRGSQAGEAGRKIPVGQVEKPRRRPACLSFSETPPTRARERNADEDVLRQNTPCEGYDHREELIQGPQPDQLGIIQMRWDDVLVRCHCTTLSLDRPKLLPRPIAGLR